MELTAQQGQHIHSRERLAFEQNSYVLPAYFEANRFFEGNSAGLVRRLLEHGGETKELAMSRLINNHFLLILVHGGDPDLPGNHYVSLSTRVADLVDALTRGESLELDLPGQNRGLLFVQQSKERNVLQHFWVAPHRSPRAVEVDRARSNLSISQLSDKQQQSGKRPAYFAKAFFPRGSALSPGVYECFRQPGRIPPARRRSMKVSTAVHGSRVAHTCRRLACVRSVNARPGPGRVPPA